MYILISTTIEHDVIETLIRSEVCIQLHVYVVCTYTIIILYYDLTMNYEYNLYKQ